MKIKILIFTCSLVLLLVYQSSGQEALTKGNYMVSGGIRLSFDDIDNSDANINTISNRKYSNFEITPAMGKLLKDNLMVGIGCGLAKTSRKSVQERNNSDTWISNVTDKENRLGLTLFLRKFWSFNERFSVYIDPHFSYNRSTRDIMENITSSNNYYNEKNSDIKYNSFRLGTGLGAYYFFNDHFAIRTNIVNLSFYKSFYENTRFDLLKEETNKFKSNDKGVNLNLVNNFSSFSINYFF